MNDADMRKYIRDLNNGLKAGNATEHTHRPALKTFLEAAYGDIQAINEPKRIECGSPDYQIAKKGGQKGDQKEDAKLTVGYIEAKDIHVDLRAIDRDSNFKNPKTPNGRQLKRYREGLPNLILTNYLEFYLYADGEKRSEACLAKLNSRDEAKRDAVGAKKTADLLEAFMSHSLLKIADPDDLARRMAGLARLIRDAIQDSFDRGEQTKDLNDLYEASKQALDSELKRNDFIHMFTQTLAYGLFAARVNHTEGKIFDREKAVYEIPSSIPFLRKMFHLIVAPELNSAPFVHYVDDLTRLLHNVNMHDLLAEFGRGTGLQDPIMHFYETFLDAYDPELRKKRGVYYTPDAVISYIVRSVDILLKERFDCADGLVNSAGGAGGSRRVLILDPACGTGSFLYAVVNHIREHFETSGRETMWKAYVKERLLPRLFGFELLTAPYAMAHLRLWMQLSALDKPPKQRDQWAYKFADDERLGVYLTNSLEEALLNDEKLSSPLAFFKDETNAADQIKKRLPVMVVLGNPPYSGHSDNTGDWIQGLINDYKEIDGDLLSNTEKALKWLQDDYVKFIRFGQWRIEETGSGILAFITNHSYIDNPTFRGMRKSLLETFDEIYLLDLHGNANKREKAPDGGKDENVFNIRQGVAVSIFVKHESGRKDENGLADVHQADLWGMREKKYEALYRTDVANTEWTQIEPKAPQYFFKKIGDEKLENLWRQWPKINDIMSVNSVGIVTARDKLTIHYTKEGLMDAVRKFAALPTEEAREFFKLRSDARDWKVELAQNDLNDSRLANENAVPILYRPFDTRWTYYTGLSRGFLCMPRPGVMRNMLMRKNIGLMFMRQVSLDGDYTHFAATRYIMEGRVFYSSQGSASIAPLYYLPKEQTSPQGHLPLESWKPNLDNSYIETLEEALRLRFTPDGPGDLSSTFGPEDVFHYIYAVFHSPTYRQRYDAFLRIDFPRVPPISDVGLFRRLVELGRELTLAHLLESRAVRGSFLRFPVSGNYVVESGHPKYVASQERVYISADRGTQKGQYYEGVPPAVWEFQLGGYQPMEKWLKDRRGRALNYDDLTHYELMAASIGETLRLAPLIDEAVGSFFG